MRKVAKVVLLLIASLALSLDEAGAGSRAELEQREAPRVLLVWHDAHHLYPGHYRGVAREVGSLFAPLDLEMRWQRAGRYDPPLDERTLLLRIVLMPSDPAGAGWELGEDVMGAVLPGNGRARSVYVFYNTLIHGLKIDSTKNRLLDFNERKLVKKALGRVVAHEIVHALAPSVSHAAQGLMRPSVTRSFLTRREVSVSVPVRQALLTGVEKALSAASPSVVSSASRDAIPQVIRGGAHRLPSDDGS